MQASCELPSSDSTEGLLVLVLCTIIAIGLARALGGCDCGDYETDDEEPPPSGMFTHHNLISLKITDTKF
jgi:hypothetical protein